MVRLTVRVTTDQQGSSVQNVFKSIIRILTRYPGFGDSISCATQAKFGVGISHIDNWSADQIDVWVDFTTGQLPTHFMTGRGAHNVNPNMHTKIDRCMYALNAEINGQLTCNLLNLRV